MRKYRTGLTKATSPETMTLFVGKGYGLFMVDGRLAGLSYGGRDIDLAKGCVDFETLKENLDFVYQQAKKDHADLPVNQFAMADGVIQWALDRCHRTLGDINRKKPLHIYGDVTGGKYPTKGMLHACSQAPHVVKGVLDASAHWADDRGKARIKDLRGRFLEDLHAMAAKGKVAEGFLRLVGVPKAPFFRLLDTAYRKAGHKLVKTMMESETPAKVLRTPVPEAALISPRWDSSLHADGGEIMSRWVDAVAAIDSKLGKTGKDRRLRKYLLETGVRLYGFSTTVFGTISSVLLEGEIFEDPDIWPGIRKRIDAFSKKHRIKKDITAYDRKYRHDSEKVVRRLFFGPDMVREKDVPDGLDRTLAKAVLLNLQPNGRNLRFLKNGKPGLKSLIAHTGMFKAAALSKGGWYTLGVETVPAWCRRRPRLRSLFNGLSWDRDTLYALTELTVSYRFDTVAKAVGGDLLERWAIRVFGRDLAGEAGKDKVDEAVAAITDALDFIEACFPDTDEDREGFDFRAVDRPFNPEMGLSAVLRLSARWHVDRENLRREEERRLREEEYRRRDEALEEVREEERRKRERPFPHAWWHPDPALAMGISVTRLENGAALKLEGKSMRHCVDGRNYMSRGLSGDMAFYHVVFGDGKRGVDKGTLSVVLAGDGNVTVSQLKAVRNHTPTPAIIEACDTWLALWNETIKERAA